MLQNVLHSTLHKKLIKKPDCVKNKQYKIKKYKYASPLAWNGHGFHPWTNYWHTTEKCIRELIIDNVRSYIIWD